MKGIGSFSARVSGIAAGQERNGLMFGRRVDKSEPSHMSVCDSFMAVSSTWSDRKEKTSRRLFRRNRKRASYGSRNTEEKSAENNKFIVRLNNVVVIVALLPTWWPP